ncbi:MAG: site-2 protease family protein [Planctomycetota bacterium]|jgi:Zn-dependent protease|nr:site-2 protease family protein [Planctomycetota bacterium]
MNGYGRSKFWTWSYPIGRISGIDVRIHWSFLLFALYFIFREGNQLVTGWSWWIPVFVVFPYLCLYGSVLLHELGHCYAARYFRLPVEQIILTPIGGLAMVGSASTPWAEFVIAACGPLVNIGLAALGLLTYGLLGGPLDVGLLVPFGSAMGQTWGGLIGSGQYLLALLLYVGVQMQIMLALFNLAFVAYPMDGGRILRSILWARMGHRRGTILSCKVAIVVAIVMMLLATTPHAGSNLMLIGMLVGFQAYQTLQMASSYGLPEPQSSVPWEAEADWWKKGDGAPRGNPRPSAKSKGKEGLFARRRVVNEKKIEQQVDQLLEKIHQEGISALSESEKKFLNKASRKFRKD